MKRYVPRMRVKEDQNVVVNSESAQNTRPFGPERPTDSGRSDQGSGDSQPIEAIVPRICPGERSTGPKTGDGDESRAVSGDISPDRAGNGEDEPGTTDEKPLTLAQTARYHEIARRLIMQHSPAEIAADIGLSERHMRRLLKHPAMLKIFREVHGEMMTDLDTLIKDEKIAPLLRMRIQSIRQQTVLQEISDEIRGRVTAGVAKATEMKVGADVAFGIIDRAKTEVSQMQKGQSGDTNVNVSLAIDPQRQGIIKDVMGETEVDLSDVLEATVIKEDSNGSP